MGVDIGVIPFNEEKFNKARYYENLQRADDKHILHMFTDKTRKEINSESYKLWQELYKEGETISDSIPELKYYVGARWYNLYLDIPDLAMELKIEQKMYKPDELNYIIKILKNISELSIPNKDTQEYVMRLLNFFVAVQENNLILIPS